MLSEDEITLVADAVKGWGNKHGALAKVQSACAEDSPDAWDDLVTLGFAGALVGEQYGGTEVGPQAAGRIMEEMGRALATSPFLSTAIMAADLIARCGSCEQKELWLPQIVQGVRFAVGLGAQLESLTGGEDTLTAVSCGDKWRLDGKKMLVRDGDSAGFLVASAKIGEGASSRVGLFVIPSDRLRRQTGMLADGSGIASFEFDQLALEPASCLSQDAFEAVGMALDLGRLMLAAEMLGAADSAFELTLGYLKERRQFGQPIGSFQALQHRAAWMFVRLELARSCVEAALADHAAANGSDVQIALASHQAKSAINLVTREMIQMHGGVGMTTANPAGLFLKRARVLEYLLGGQAADVSRYAAIRQV